MMGNSLLWQSLAAVIGVVSVLSLSRSERVKEVALTYTAGIVFGAASLVCALNAGGAGADLRYAPLILAFAYGGMRGGSVASVMLLGCRIAVGGDALWTGAAADVMAAALAAGFTVRIAGQWLRRNWAGAIGLGLASVVLTRLETVFMAPQGKTAWLLDNWQVLASEAGAALFTLGLGLYMLELGHENARLRRESEKAERLGIVSEMAAGVAHEVRNPIQVVRGFMQLIGRSLDAKNKAYIQTAIAELDRADFIISDYLNLARPQKEEIQLISLTEELHAIRETMNSYALMHSVELTEYCQPDLYIHADRAKFKQAIINLVKNGIEALKDGGTIELRACRDGHNAVIHVIDTGEGMTQEELAKLGSPFFSTKATGTGLGLTVTFRIIQIMRGKIEFHSQKGCGTQATITMPAANSLAT